MTEYIGTASPFASAITWPAPRSRVSEMNVPVKRNSSIRCLWSWPEIQGVAEPISPGAYCAVSIRKP